MSFFIPSDGLGQDPAGRVRRCCGMDGCCFVHVAMFDLGYVPVRRSSFIAMPLEHGVIAVNQWAGG